jgi:hypothetical protein
MGEWGDSVYVFSQIMALCSCICYVITYLQKKWVFILTWGGLSATFLAISYINLGSIIAAIMELIVIPRNMAIYFVNRRRTNENKRKVLKQDWAILAASTAVVVVSAFLAWNSPWCIFILVGGMLYNAAICQKNIGIYCDICLCGLACYFIYDFYLGSVVSIIFDACILVGNAVGIINYYKKHRVPHLVSPLGIWINE